MKTLSTILVSLFFVIAGGLYLEARTEIAALEQLVAGQRPVREWQVFLNAQECPRYECGRVDDNPGRKFQEAYRNWRNDQCAIVYFEGE